LAKSVSNKGKTDGFGGFGQKRPFLVKNGQKRSKTVKKWSKTVKKWSKRVPFWSKTPLFDPF